MLKNIKKIGLAVILSLTLCSFAGCNTSDTNKSDLQGETKSGASGISNNFNNDVNDFSDDNSYGSIENVSNDSFDSNIASKSDIASKTDVNSDKIVYTCNIQLETLEYEDSYKSLKEKISNFNGFVQMEDETDNDYNWYYNDYQKKTATKNVTVSARIPSDNYEKFIEEIENEGKVVSKQSNASNISKQYSDTETVIKSLKIQEKRLLNMMKEAKTIQDMIAVEDRLTEVQTHLNMYKTDLSSMDSDIDYSTVTIVLREVMEYTPEINTVTFLDRLKNTFSDSWDGFKGTLESILFFIIIAVPQLIVFGIVILVICIITRKIIQKIKKNKDKK